MYLQKHYFCSRNFTKQPTRRMLKERYLGMDIECIIEQQIRDSIFVKEKILESPDILKIIRNAAELVVNAYRENKKTILAGNGGSAADAQHLAGEFVSRFYFDRPGIPSISLATDTSIITAIGNDYGFDKLFARQIQANGNQGDVFIGITTSGNSENIVQALYMCREKGIKTIILAGERGGKVESLCDFCIKVPSVETPRIQESHILIGHIICCIVERELFGSLQSI